MGLGVQVGELRAVECEQNVTDFDVIRADAVEDGVSSVCIISKTGESMVDREERRGRWGMGSRTHGRM